MHLNLHLPDLALPGYLIHQKMLLIVGGARCGTTSLHAALMSTSHFQDSGIKEHHFWDSYCSKYLINETLSGWNQAQISNYSYKQLYTKNISLLDATSTDKEYLMGLRNDLVKCPQNYWKQYEYCCKKFGDKQYILDSTPAYSLLNNNSLEFLKKSCPSNLFIIFITKDPVRRFISGLAKAITDKNSEINKILFNQKLLHKLTTFIKNRDDNIQYKKSQIGSIALNLRQNFSKDQLLILKSELMFDQSFEEDFRLQINQFLGLPANTCISMPNINRNKIKSYVPQELIIKLEEVFANEYVILNSLDQS